MATIAPTLVILGPTASGKSQLALDIAERHNGEIIAADSRTLYKGLDIGTAKPTAEERQRVPHHMIDVLTPDQEFNVYEFQQQARKLIAEIRERRNLPIIVGGTGLYIDSLVLDYQLSGERQDVQQRQVLQDLSIEDLQMKLKNQRIPLPENTRNKRYLISALLRKDLITTKQTEPSKDYIVVGLATKKDILQKRIAQRAKQMFADGVIEEAAAIAKIYGWDSPGLSGNIYPIIHRHISGELSLQEAIERSAIKDRQLAKRQLTWFRRHSWIYWLSAEDAANYIATQLTHTDR